jgi:hypothetical protein
VGKITDLAAMAALVRQDDLLALVDVHDTSMASTGTDKKLTIGQVRAHNTFHIDDYGADPTGASLSDTAWTNAYSDATTALQTNGGAMVVFGCGQYRFSVNTVSITDSRIGIRGQGRVATTIYTTTGSGGVLVSAVGTTSNSSQGAAPVTGFNLYGWNAPAGTCGLRYGDRLNGSLTDVSASGFGGAGARGFWFRDNTANSEGSFIWAAADNCTVCYDFDQVTPSGSGGSFDYSQIYLHLGLTTSPGPGVSAIGVRFQNGMHCNGAYLAVRGNVHASSGLTSTVIAIGNSVSDNAKVAQTRFDVQVECDNSAGSVFDFVIQGTDSSCGILHCNGIMWMPNFGGTYTAGSVTSPAVLQCAGVLQGALFSSHGSFTTGSNGGTFSVYSG